jgi:hypothetical protein
MLNRRSRYLIRLVTFITCASFDLSQFESYFNIAGVSRPARIRDGNGRWRA